MPAASPRLFTALLPSDDAVRALRDAVHEVPDVTGLRWLAPRQWHITLGFFGADEVHTRDAWLRPRLAGMAAPRIRFAGAGTFRGVLWCGVVGDDLGALAEAAGAASVDREFHPHVTLARGRPPGGLGVVARRLEQHDGPSWSATEVVLMRSDRGDSGSRYTAVARYPLDTASTTGRSSAQAC